MEWLLLAHGHGDSCDFSRHSGRGLDFHCFLSILTQKAERRMLAPYVSVRQRDKKQCPVLTMAVSHLFPFEVTAPREGYVVLREVLEYGLEQAYCGQVKKMLHMMTGRSGVHRVSALKCAETKQKERDVFLNTPGGCQSFRSVSTLVIFFPYELHKINVLELIKQRKMC